MEADVAHHSSYDRILLQAAFFFQLQRAEQHDLVAVHILPLFIDGQTAVGVAVIGNADIGAAAQHRFLQIFQMGGAAVVIDIHAVRLRMNGNDFGPQALQDFRPDRIGRAIGTVVHDL